MDQMPQQQQMSPDMLMAMMTDPRATPQQKMAAMSALNAMKGGPSSPAPMPKMDGDSTGISTMHPAFAAAVRNEVAGGNQGAPAPAAQAPPGSPTTAALMSGAADASRVAGGMARGGAVRGYADGGDVTTDIDPSTMTGGDMDPGQAPAPAAAPDDDKHGYYALIRKQLAGGNGSVSPDDKWMALLQASLGTMAAASKPGATFLGSIGQGGTEGIAGFRQLQAQRAEDRMKNASLAGSLAEHDATIQARKDALAQAANEANLTRQAAKERADADRAARADYQGGLLDLKQQLLDQKNATAADKVAAAAAATPPKKEDGQSSDDYLANLQQWDPGFAAQAQAIANYQQPLASSRSGKPSPLNEAAYAINPNLDQKQYKARNETVTDFTKGKMADAKMFLDRTVNNLAEWDGTAKALNNFGGAATPLNAPINTIQATFGADAPTNYSNTQNALATEMRNVFAKSGAGSLTELKSWESGLGRGFSPKQFEGAKKTFLKLFDGQLNAVADRWNRAMPEKKTKADFLSPESLDKLAQVAPDYYKSITGKDAPDATAAPAAGTAPTRPPLSSFGKP